MLSCLRFVLNSLLQVRMQTQTMTGTYYSGMGDCVQTVWRTEGIKAFYRGIAAPMSSYGLIKSITFGSYVNCLDLFKKRRITNGQWDGTRCGSSSSRAAWAASRARW